MKEFLEVFFKIVPINRPWSISLLLGVVGAVSSSYLMQTTVETALRQMSEGAEAVNDFHGDFFQLVPVSAEWVQWKGEEKRPSIRNFFPLDEADRKHVRRHLQVHDEILVALRQKPTTPEVRTQWQAYFNLADPELNKLVADEPKVIEINKRAADIWKKSQAAESAINLTWYAMDTCTTRLWFFGWVRRLSAVLIAVGAALGIWAGYSAWKRSRPVPAIVKVPAPMLTNALTKRNKRKGRR